MEEIVDSCYNAYERDLYTTVRNRKVWKRISS